jgi:hypothetical protein
MSSETGVAQADKQGDRRGATSHRANAVEPSHEPQWYVTPDGQNVRAGGTALVGPTTFDRLAKWIGRLTRA